MIENLYAQKLALNKAINVLHNENSALWDQVDRLEQQMYSLQDEISENEEAV